MFHKGLNKDIIIAAAKELIEQEGFQQFSMRKLAEILGVKTASLYTHIESMEMLFTEVGLSTLKEQREYLMSAVKESMAIMQWLHWQMHSADLLLSIRNFTGSSCRSQPELMRI